jgi:ABC-type transport system involved in multi-copper enzyme maturation permease subunit
VNPTILQATWQERLSHPIRLGSLLGAFLLPLVTTAIDPEPQLAESFWAEGFAAILATGIIGLEISSGSLALVFTRPIARGAYVVSRWTAVATIAIGFSILQLACQVVLMRSAGHSVPVELLFFDAADRIFLAGGVSAVFLLFSCIGSSIADLFFWAGANVLADVLQVSGRLTGHASLARAGRWVNELVNPHFDLYRFVFSSPLPWSEALRYASVLSICLVLATSLINRRELSYATG